MRWRRFGVALALAVGLGSTALPGVAHAATVSCGDVILTSTTLEADVGPCPGPGITLGADNITLDLGGHTIVGSPSSSVGVDLTGRSGVRVQNGTVTGFQTGVGTAFRFGNTIERLAIRGNRCVGVALHGSEHLVRGNDISRNGCQGVAVAGASSSTIEGNNIAGNGGAGVTFVRGSLNYPGQQNLLRRNAITGNRSDGVTIRPLALAQSVVDNHIARNGGNGVYIDVFSGDQCCQLVQGNSLFGNGANGVLIEANRPYSAPPPMRNRVLDNVAYTNGVFDLADLNLACDANTWAGNRFGTRNQPCVN